MNICKFRNRECKIILNGAISNIAAYSNFFLLQILQIQKANGLFWSKKSCGGSEWYYDYLEDGKYYWWALKDEVKIIKKEIDIE